MIEGILVSIAGLAVLLTVACGFYCRDVNPERKKALD